ncbi:MAG: 2-isopropylmalate synthase [Succiniclasticum sp.]|nr:2-isopropylmalate synthase [Succiniclasticum sp.]MDY6086893.1 2-isopropylmalate synthase [Succiniclasticum sp.]
MQRPEKQYRPFEQIKLERRDWPDRTIEKAPVWCSVDLRDGNQALVIPMQKEAKLRLFKTLLEIGFKEIEVGFPSASDTEYEIIRTLIENNMVPDDVTLQVLVQARPELIRKTFEAVKGARNVIIHFYNSTSALQRKIVFQKDMDGIVDIAVQGAKLIRRLTEEEVARSGMHIRYEYSPESYTGTEQDFAVRICHEVMETLGADAAHPVIINLPATVEMCTPNTYADQIEYFIKHLPNREAAVISLHPHNDRGTGVACAELGLLAGADRIEGCLFGNGERTGNLDLVTVALNMYTQGIDPGLDFHDILAVGKVYEECTGMSIPPRQPYAGALSFTAFSGSHQDAIKKGFDYMKQSRTDYWEVPYLPINPADINRQYEPVIRINSQSGKGGAAFVLEQAKGYRMPKAMQPEFGEVIKAAADAYGKELNEGQIVELFRTEFIDRKGKYELLERHIQYGSTGANDSKNPTSFTGILAIDGEEVPVSGQGNGPIDAFFNGLEKIGIKGYKFLNYDEHAISEGSDAKAICYIQLEKPDGASIFGVGVHSGITTASLLGIICAINRAEGRKK